MFLFFLEKGREYKSRNNRVFSSKSSAGGVVTLRRTGVQACQVQPMLVHTVCLVLLNFVFFNFTFLSMSVCFQHDVNLITGEFDIF